MGVGRMGATELLAQLIATIPDPDGHGVAVGAMVAVSSGVAAKVTLPSGDCYLVVVQWQGDREGDGPV